jgi:hypothetical protein
MGGGANPHPFDILVLSGDKNMDNVIFLGQKQLRVLTYTTKNGHQRNLVINSSKMWSAICDLRARGCKNINLL